MSAMTAPESIEGIAIIGMACRFPGAADLDAFWRNLRDGVESVSFFSDDELLAAGVEPALLRRPNYVRAGAVLEDADRFDAAFFGFNRREAEIMDPQQRLFLECAYTALEHAGYDPRQYDGLIGAYAGAGANRYLANVLANTDIVASSGLYQIMTLNERDFLVTRLAYKLNLRGPCVNVQSACSTSLVAVHMACQGLLTFECDMALAGGVSQHIPQKAGYLYQDRGIASPDGHCRAFDAQAQGTVFGSGVGAVVLKRLADALEDGDSIHAVIRGSAINNDGALKVGFTAPSEEGQARVIADAFELSGVAPETIAYIEAHGTATPLGDPIEIAALNQVFGGSPARKDSCALGSVKTNVGHLDTAAGVAGLIKAVLALEHRQIPPSLHFERPNPNIDFAHGPFYVNSRLAEWQAHGHPRRAGVNSFGIGGTNAHVILEEAPAVAARPTTCSSHLLLLSARSETALATATANLAAFLKQHPDVDLADVAYTLHVGRHPFRHRRMLVCRDRIEGLAALEAPGSGSVISAVAKAPPPSVAFLFPGQGSQYIQMASEIYQAQPLFRAHLDRCADLLVPHLGLDIRTILYPDERRTTNDDRRPTTDDRRTTTNHRQGDTETRRQGEGESETQHSTLNTQNFSSILDQTQYTQPALFVIEYAMAQLWQEWGLCPQAMIGHSIGEYVAACLAGVFSLEDALRLVAARGRLMQSLPAGAMLAVPLAEAQLQPLLGAHLSLGAVNGPALCVASGPPEEIDRLADRLAGQGVDCRRLSVSHAFHSPMMDSILESFGAQVEQVRLHPPQIPYISNVTGRWISAAEATDPAYWTAHLRQPVRFAEGLETLFEDSNQILLEVGPGRTLTTLADRHPHRPPEQVVLASLRAPNDRRTDMAVLFNALGRLWLSGVAVSWNRLYAHERRRRVPLPPYPFERESYWIAAPNQQDTTAVEMQTEAPMSDIQLDAQPRSLRHEQIVSTLCALIVDLTGETPDRTWVDTPFFDLGLDSLLIIQFNQAMQDTYGVGISLVQLLEEYSTLNSLAVYIDQALPPDRPQPIIPPIVAPVVSPQPQQALTTRAPVPAAGDNGRAAVAAPVAVQNYAITAQDASPSSALERIISQHLQVMSQLIGAFHNPGSPPPAAPLAALVEPAKQDGAAPPAHDRGHGAARSPVEHPQALVAAPSPPVRGDETKPAPFVPHRPAELSAGVELTPQQRRYLETFVERYTARTKESKRQAQHYRQPLADGRWTSAFRLVWKELVYPIVGHHALGSRLWDVDGNQYVDITMGFGVNFFGHSALFITKAIEEQLKAGAPLGPQSHLAGRAAELICELTGVERVNFVNSGTEAVMAALRIARTVTRRSKIACFAGAYHGWSDGTLARPVMRNGVLHSVPVAPGVSPQAIEDVLVLEYDNPQSIELLKAHAHELAAVLVEPVQSRRPDLQPRAFLHALRDWTTKEGIALIFDEMINGFRIHPGGAQAWFGVRADIVTYGKIVGGGLPIGVIAGRAAYMDAFDGGMWDYGDGSYPQADKTFVGGAFFKHPLTMAAALAVLEHMKAVGPALQEQVNQRTARFAERLNTYFERAQVPIRVTYFSSVFRFNLPREAKFLDLFFYHLIDKGIYTWEGGNCFLSTAHTDEDMEYMIDAVQASVEDLRSGGFLPPAPTGGSNGQAVNGQNGTRSFQRPVQLPLATAAAQPGPQADPTAALAAALSQPRGPSAPSKAGSPVAARPAPARSIEFSLFYFGNYDAGFSADKYDLLFKGATFADDNGFAAVWIPERHFHSFGGFSPNPSVVAAALARETRQIQLRAGSVVLPLHHPIRVAEEWSVVDNLSNGRVGISFASGWHPDDFVFAPTAYENRREIMSEGIDIVRRLWRGEGIDVPSGGKDRVCAKIFPLPRQPELPIWLTCSHEESFIKAGSIGANVLSNLLDQNLEAMETKIASYRRSLAQHGYDPRSGIVTLQLHTFIAGDLNAAVTKARDPFYNYIKSSFGLIQNMAKGRGMRIDFQRMSEADLQAVLVDAYERIVQTGALIGTPESCAPLVDKLIAIGVDEVACLVDFGIDTLAVLDSFQHLSALKARYETASALRRPISAIQPEAPTAHESAGAGGVGVAADSLATSTLPLTETQRGLWVFAHFGDREASLYNESLALQLQGPLQQAALHRALHEVVNRHESLRTTFSSDGEHQRVAASLEVALPFIDLSEADRAQRESQAAELIAQDARRPFDFVNGPLFRVHLIKLQEQEHLLTLTLHHIITDGWSIEIIIREIQALYTALSQGNVCQLPAPRQFSEYIRWLEHQEQTPAMKKAETYWIDRFSGSAAALELPTDLPRPPVRTFAGAQLSVDIEPALYADLKALAQRNSCTLFMVLLAGFNILLHRLSGQSDIVVGVPTAGQLMMGNAYLTGYCLNLLPIRSKVIGGNSFIDHLKPVKIALMGAYENQIYSLGKLINKLNIGRDLSRPPLVSVVLNLEKGDNNKELELGALKATMLSNFSGFARFDINVNVDELEDTLRLRCDYNADIFEGQTILRWLTHFQTVLAGAVAAPERPVATLPLLSPADLRHLLVTRNATAAPFPAALPLHALIAAQAARSPDAIALLFLDQHLSFHALDARANRLAHHLQALGVGPDVPVGVCLARSPELLIALLAIFKAGGAFVPLDPSFPPDRLAFILHDAQVRVLLTQTALAPWLPATPCPLLCLDQHPCTAPQLSQPTTPPFSSVSADNLAYLIYTSGSTGRPKGVLVPHRALVNYLHWCISAYTAASGTGAPVQASIAADAIFPSLFAPLLVGTRVLLLEQDAGLAALGAALEREAPFSLIKITPSQLDVLRQHLPSTPPRSAWVSTLVVGAEEVRAEVLARWRAVAPQARVLDEYGPTETVVGCSVYAVPETLHTGTVPIGRPIANMQFYVLDAAMQPLPVGVPGELYIGGAGLAWGYHNRPDLTAEKFVPNPFQTLNDKRETRNEALVNPNSAFSVQPLALGGRLYKTGDLVRLLADEQANIEFLGRLDDQVKIRGYRVEPGEVAAVLEQHAAVAEAVVLAREVQAGERQLVAYVTLTTTDHRPPTTDRDSSLLSRHSSLVGELRAFLSTRLPEYMVPSAYVALERIPLTAHGKVDRGALPAVERAAVEAAELVKARTAVEAQLVAIWEQVLALAPIGIFDNFFRIGGHSLLAVQLISRIRDAFQVELALQSVFEFPTVAGLAEIVSQRQGEEQNQRIDRVGAGSEAQIRSTLDLFSDQEVDTLLSDMLAEEGLAE